MSILFMRHFKIYYRLYKLICALASVTDKGSKHGSRLLDD